MNQEQYDKLSKACDCILLQSSTPFEIVANPLLHVLTEIPSQIERHTDLFKHDNTPNSVVDIAFCRKSYHILKKIIKTLTTSIKYGYSEHILIQDFLSKHNYKPDVVLVSWLVNIDHLNEEDDFYMGNMQTILAEYGFSSILVLRNQSGRPSSMLLKKSLKSGPCARLLLPDVCFFTNELFFIYQYLMATDKLKEIAESFNFAFIYKLAQLACAMPGIIEWVKNFRLHFQMLQLFRQISPKMIITLYEGHAWERCVYHASRKSFKNIFCVGYSHTVLRKRAHAMRRNLQKSYNPDLILTIGEITQQSLTKSPLLENTPVFCLGTFRKSTQSTLPEKPTLNKTFLVLPEGIEQECVFLFEFAIKCANLMPKCRFIFRTHPLLPFRKLNTKIKNYHPDIHNISISKEKSINEDFKRSGFLLYRGSSTIIYSILFGLKPFYVSAPHEKMSIDPLYELNVWRENVRTVEEVNKIYKDCISNLNDKLIEEWAIARAFCHKYVKPINKKILHSILKKKFRC